MSFLRNINKVEEFNDDAGADIGDLTGSANLSFDDIKHIRNEGIYNSNSNLDTAPIIPTLGTFGRVAPVNINGKLSNVQYRKQMNQQKKMALLNGARANSLAAGGNPMQEGPRANSMAAGMNPMHDGMRTNTMAGSYSMMSDQRYQFSQQQMGSDPRSMSMTSQRGNLMRSQQQQFSMRPQQQYPPQQGQPFDQGARSMSLMGGGMPGYGQNYPRTKSLGGSRPFMGPQGGQGPQGPQGYQGPPLRSKNLVMSNPQPQISQGPPFRNQMPINSQSQFYQEQDLRSNGQYQPGPGYAGAATTNNPESNYAPNGPQPRTYTEHTTQYLPQTRAGNQPYSQQLQQPSQFQNHPNNPPNLSRNEQLQPNQQEQIVQDPSVQGSIKQNSTEALGEVIEEEEDNQNPVQNEDTDEDVIYKFGEEDSKGIQLSRKSTLKKHNSMRVRKLNLFNDGEPNDYQEGKDVQPNSSHQQLEPVASKESLATTGNKEVPSVAPPEKEVESRNINAPLGSDSRSIISDIRKPSESQSLHSIVANTAFNNFRSASSGTPQFSNPQLFEARTQSPSSFYEASESPVANNFDSESEFGKARQNDNGEITPSTAPASHASHSADGAYDGKFDNYSNITEPIQDVSESENKGRYSPVRDNVPEVPIKSRTFTDDTEKPPFNQAGGSSNSIPRSFSSASHSSQSSKKEKRSSFSGRNFLKRLSRSKRSSVVEPDREPNVTSHQRTLSSNTITSSLNERSTYAKPLPFTKDEMHIMNCNTELLNELESITRELASSIKRELSLETRLKNQTVYSRSPNGEPENLESVVIEKSRAIVDLQEKLNKEKRLRFISEEHALLSEQGQSPSALKLEYEKTEIYNQLVAKNDLVNQLQNRISELESQEQVDINAMDSNLIEKIQILQAENEDLINQNYSQKEEIKILEGQRDELREVIGKLSSQNSQDSKFLNDKIKALEMKCQNLKGMNDKLTNREGNGNSSHEQSFGFNRFGSRSKLNGFTIVSPNERFLEDR
ncbi:hypothetical protein CANMA_001455 [Candida margitis]|uniref:uncharacterized protein n=1 Tax=Candida margitis TaxID=1775924 RepID=UPI002227B3AE|nr:uncharacterized protein CANMA_001455 [Candida margitis]KAI5969388.1 hypothetical protein CANMA_001455 [Candida margitis]